MLTFNGTVQKVASLAPWLPLQSDKGSQVLLLHDVKGRHKADI